MPPPSYGGGAPDGGGGGRPHRRSPKISDLKLAGTSTGAFPPPPPPAPPPPHHGGGATMGRRTQSRGLRRTMQLPPAALNFAHSAFAACRLSSETRTRNGTPARRRPFRTSGRRSPRTALYLRRSRS